MCGITGFIDKKTINQKQIIIKKMADRIAHRGPDSEGYFCNGKIALGFRRLSIIDLKSGSQPIYNEDKSKLIMFNGEIYNYQEIKADLIKLNHKFTTNTDTEVILHGYEEYQEKIFSKLRGMFAFVIYDIKKDELIGARDLFGIKPLYYYKDNNTFIFGSEIKSFLEHPNYKKELNKDAIEPYLCFQTNPLNETMFKNVFKLLPGHYFKYKNNNLDIFEYANLDYEKVNNSYDYYKDLAAKTLEESIKYHQISDVEVGSYLSGGVDSSYVVRQAKPDKTFTVGFPGKGFSEIPYAKKLSKELGVNNYSQVINADDFFNILPTIEYHADEPSANLSMVPLYFLSKMAREQVKVVLSGEGSDEIFGGYNEYYVPTLQKIYLSCPLILRKFNANVASKLPYFKGKNTIIKYGTKLEERYFGRVNVMSAKRANEFLNSKYQSNLTPEMICKPFYDQVKDKDDILKKMYIDLHFWLPNDILLKADKMSMANSVELRVPFLDKEMWNISKQIPTKFFVMNGETKHIFRDIATESLPLEWAKRPKLGFPVPFVNWLKEEKYYKIVKKTFNTKEAKEFFDIKLLNKILDNHYNNIKNSTREIYTLYVFLVWYKRYFIDEK